ncbi:MAG: hypothetical protein EAZ60_28565, partial [Oscillatoriales cyanobacterium]
MGVKKQVVALKRNERSDTGASINSRNPYGAWLLKKVKNIFAKSLTSPCEISILIKRQRESGSHREL